MYEWCLCDTQSKLGENYLRFHTARVRDVELLTGFSLFNGMIPLNRVKLVTFQTETLWPRPSWRDLGKTTATQYPPLNSSFAFCPARSYLPFLSRVDTAMFTRDIYITILSVCLHVPVPILYRNGLTHHHIFFISACDRLFRRCHSLRVRWIQVGYID